MIVRQREIADGAEDYAAGSEGLGLWVADVERPAPQNRDGYQPYLDDADALLTESCRPTSHAPDTRPPALRIKASGRQRNAIVVTARCPREACVVGAQAAPRRRVRAAAVVESDNEAVELTLRARARRSAKLVVTVTAVDASGNATRREKRVTLLR